MAQDPDARRPRDARAVALGLAAILAALCPAHAFATGEAPRVRAVRTETPPVIDGRLDDAVWSEGGLANDLREVTPIEGRVPDDATEIRVLYDRDHLYLGVRLYDRDPGDITINKLERDADMQSEDSISFVFDTLLDRRNGYFLQVSAAGLRRDALVEGGRNFIPEWDGIWFAKAHVDEQGWTLELALPFKTVSFDPTKSEWGFNANRRLRHLDQEHRWSNPSQDYSTIDVANAGIIYGLQDLEQGWGLDVKPALPLVYTSEEDNSGDRGDKDLQARPGGDVFYKLTPSLTGVLTFNTDFSEAPADDLRDNLTRFALFFPETRDFFLQDAGIFEFGGLTEENGLPFFSRRIGLTSDEDVNLRRGAKLTGKVGRWNVGALAVQMEPYDDVERKDLIVARMAADVLDDSSLGFIYTRGDPFSNDENQLLGADFRYQNNDVGSQGRRFTTDLWYQRTRSEDARGYRENAFGTKLEYPNDRWNWRARFAEFQENYNPGLGFGIRTGIRQFDARVRFRARPDWRLVRTFDSQLEQIVVTDRDGRLETFRSIFDFVDVRNDPGDRLRLRYQYESDVNPDGGLALVDTAGAPRRVAFDLFGDDLAVEADHYRTHQISALYEAGVARRVSGSLELVYGGLFAGRTLQMIGKLDLRPSPHFNVTFEWEERRLRDVGFAIEARDVDGEPTLVSSELVGDTSRRVARVRLVVNLNADVSWRTLAQYSNSADLVDVNSRLRWILRPGNELFLVWNQRMKATADVLRPSRTEGVAKIVYTFRF